MTPAELVLIAGPLDTGDSRAVEISGGRNLMAKVLFARHYARLVFDQGLHDRLLGEVLAGGGASDDPSSHTYHGDFPFSAPEVDAIRTFVESRIIDAIDWHVRRRQ